MGQSPKQAYTCDRCGAFHISMDNRLWNLKVNRKNILLERALLNLIRRKYQIISFPSHCIIDLIYRLTSAGIEVKRRLIRKKKWIAPERIPLFWRFYPLSVLMDLKVILTGSIRFWVDKCGHSHIIKINYGACRKYRIDVMLNKIKCR